MQGEAERKPFAHQPGRTGKPVLPHGRQGRGQRGLYPGRDPGGRTAGRGGADAQVLRGAGDRKMQRAGVEAVV